ncbi:hypothetical protein R1sor_016396 [Riccia sorocarpa]|uniref:Uncharacterized protein n=1 Tax=Riccia sorocarpa TaxID=122646 RepID=A0ABD3HI44_9MARC
MPPAPRRPRLDAARLPVTCHCVKCKGMMTRTAIEAERHIQQWGRHDEGESSRVASDRGREMLIPGEVRACLREEYRYVDDDPARCPNLAGNINSVVGTRRPTREPNAM